MKARDYKIVKNVLLDYLTNTNYAGIRVLSEAYSPFLEEVYDNNLFNIESDEFSTNIELNRAISICEDYLYSFSPELADRFHNIIRTVDENGCPIVNFSYEEHGINDGSCLDTDGKIYIKLKNNLFDIRTILHELFHKLNEYCLVVEGTNARTLANRMYTETVSFISEIGIIRYLLDKGYITDNDCSLLMNERIKNSEYAARYIIFENELIEMLKLGIELNDDNILAIAESYGEESKGLVLKDSINDKGHLEEIVNTKRLLTPESLPYLIGQYYYELVIDREDIDEILLEINELVSTNDIIPTDIANYFVKKLARR